MSELTYDKCFDYIRKNLSVSRKKLFFTLNRNEMKEFTDELIAA